MPSTYNLPLPAGAHIVHLPIWPNNTFPEKQQPRKYPKNRPEFLQFGVRENVVKLFGVCYNK